MLVHIKYVKIWKRIKINSKSNQNQEYAYMNICMNIYECAISNDNVHLSATRKQVIKPKNSRALGMHFRYIHNCISVCVCMYVCECVC